MSNWTKNLNIHWYGNLNKLILLGVLLSIPIIGFGIYLWSRYLAARIVVWVVVGLVSMGLFSILLRWTKKAVGIKKHNSHHNHHHNSQHFNSRNPHHRHKHH